MAGGPERRLGRWPIPAAQVPESAVLGGRPPTCRRPNTEVAGRAAWAGIC